jgi:hypothetical protein
LPDVVIGIKRANRDRSAKENPVGQKIDKKFPQNREAVRYLFQPRIFVSGSQDNKDRVIELEGCDHRLPKKPVANISELL